ncbi:hypothetical protein RFI_28758, partial [Reticulomyxa filosa]
GQLQKSRKAKNISNVITEVTEMTDQKQKLDLKKQKRTQSEQEPTPYHNTICHESCGLNETTVKGSDIFKDCVAMSGDHCKASTDIDSKNQLLQSLNATVDNYENEIANKQTEIKDLITQMKDICSDFNYAKEIDLAHPLLWNLVHFAFPPHSPNNYNILNKKRSKKKKQIVKNHFIFHHIWFLRKLYLNLQRLQLSVHSKKKIKIAH